MAARAPDSRINRRGATQAGNKQGEPGDEGDPLQHVAVPVEDELSERQAGCWAAGLLGCWAAGRQLALTHPRWQDGQKWKSASGTGIILNVG